MLNLLETYFIRHNFEVWKDPGIWKNKDLEKTQAVMKEAWEKRFAVIDYLEVKDETNAFNPDAENYMNYISAQKTLRKLNRFLETGGLLAIFSLKSHPDKLLIGRVGPKSKGRLHCFDAYPEYSFKVIELEFVEEVSIREYPGLFSKIPRQTAFTRWPLANKTLNQIYRKEKPDINEVEDLDNSQLEILCYEWLRANGKIKHLTLPIGRTMVHVDIVGVNDLFRKLFAQVTFSSQNNSNKVDALKNFSEEDERFLFCKGETKVQDAIKFVSIDEVFGYFKKSSDGQKFLESLVGVGIH